MYATLHQLTSVPGPQDLGWVDEVIDCLARAGGPAGVLASRPMSMGAGMAIAFWESEDDAAHSADLEPVQLPSGVGVGAGTFVEVVAHHDATSCEPARYVQILAFDGPRPLNWVQAFDRAGVERIVPAIRDTPGLAGMLTLRSEDGATFTLTLAASVDAIEEGVRRIFTTTLLPWEDPAHLTGPSRVDVERVLHADLPAFMNA